MVAGVELVERAEEGEHRLLVLHESEGLLPPPPELSRVSRAGSFAPVQLGEDRWGLAWSVGGVFDELDLALSRSSFHTHVRIFEWADGSWLPPRELVDFESDQPIEI